MTSTRSGPGTWLVRRTATVSSIPATVCASTVSEPAGTTSAAAGVPLTTNAAAANSTATSDRIGIPQNVRRSPTRRVGREMEPT
jgi:hypothetical protein